MRAVPIIRQAFLWGVALTLLGAARADDPPPAPVGAPAAEQRWAVIVGVDQYTDPAIPRLRFSAADARLLAETLVKHCGYAPERVLVLADDRKEQDLRPIRSNLKDQLPAWLAKAGPGDTVVVYFSGHGFLDDGGQGYLAPQDCRRTELAATGLRTDEIDIMLQQCKAKRKLLLLDCCHAGGARGGANIDPSSQELGNGFQSAEGLVTLASCSKSEQSHEWDERGHGLFTYFVAEGLKGAADRDHDGVVNSDELYYYIFDKVSIAARKELNVRQTPIRTIHGGGIGMFALARVAGRAPAPLRPALENPLAPAVPMRIAAGPARFEFLGSLAGAKGPAVFSPDGKTLATGGITLWDVPTREERSILKSTKFQGDRDATGPIGFSLDGKWLIASATEPNNRNLLEVWDVDASKSRLGRGFIETQAHDEYLHPAPCPDGRLALVHRIYVRARAESRHNLVLWDPKTGKEQSLLNGPAVEKIARIAVSPTGKMLATADIAGNIVVRDLATGRELTSISAHAAFIWNLVFSPQGDILASSSMSDRSLKLWNPETGAKRGTLLMDREGVYQKVVFHPVARFVATGCNLIMRPDDKEKLVNMSFWDTTTCKRWPITDVEAVDPLAFSPDGTVLAATTRDSIGLWAVHIDGK